MGWNRPACKSMARAIGRGDNKRGGHAMSTEASNRETHWRRTRTLMSVHMIIWFIFSYLVHWFATDLNAFKFNDFPLGYYMAAQGSLIAFVVQLFVFSWQQHKVDVECGMAEPE